MKLDEQDVFEKARSSSEVSVIDILNEEIPILLTYSDVRSAAKNWRVFSSDAPYKVPIPSEEKERRFRQLPIETDPPKHHLYRQIIEPIFRKPADKQYVRQIRDLTVELIGECLKRNKVDVVREFALPFQSRALSYLLCVPEKEADVWISWGTHVFKDGEDSASKGAALETYIRDAFDRAEDWADQSNFFTHLNVAQIEGRALSEVEKMGLANLVFAGGRDTVINMISFIVRYFAERRSRLSMMKYQDRLINLAVEELVRFVSPLTHIGRVCSQQTRVGGQSIGKGERVSLCWAAANFDKGIFDEPHRIKLDRVPNPHVAFGSAHHRCLGALQARVIMRELIRGLAELTSKIVVLEDVPNIECIGNFRRRVGYERLVVQLLK